MILIFNEGQKVDAIILDKSNNGVYGVVECFYCKAQRALVKDTPMYERQGEDWIADDIWDFAKLHSCNKWRRIKRIRAELVIYAVIALAQLAVWYML